VDSSGAFRVSFLPVSISLANAASIDALGRMISNVGVPAVFALVLLWQITPRLDRIGDLRAGQNTSLAVLQASCVGQGRPLAP
jgi:hypothetical protein